MKKKLPKYLLEPEYITLTASLRASRADVCKRDMLAFDMMYKMGFRVSEVANLTMSNINLKRGLITIIDGKVGDGILAIPNSLLPQVNEWLEIRTTVMANNGTESKYLFIPVSNRKPTLHQCKTFAKVNANQWQRKCYELSKKTGITLADGSLVSIHKLRHSCCVNFLAKTGDLLLAKNVLRHANIQTTMTYADITNERLFEAMRAI